MDTQKMVRVFFLLSIFFIFACKNTNTVKNIDNKNQVSDVVVPTVNDFHILKVKDGQKLWEMDAKVAFLKEDAKIVDVEDGKVKLYDKDSFVASVFFEKARFFNDTGNIDFFGKTLIHTVENEKIITYDIKYIYAQNKVFSEKEIEIHKEATVIKGIGFETFDGFKTIRIYKNVIDAQ
ncbi:MAG: LPS export ABC transporter periplasmic protein LptC [Endomicrobiia bacterium]